MLQLVLWLVPQPVVRLVPQLILRLKPQLVPLLIARQSRWRRPIRQGC